MTEGDRSDTSYFKGRYLMTESDEQIKLLMWASRYAIEEGRLGQYIFAIPNEGKRGFKTAARLKAQGLRSGVPDLMLALPRHGAPGLFIEMKKEKGGTVSANQLKWLERLSGAGYATAVCHGCEKAKETILAYLGEV